MELIPRRVFHSPKLQSMTTKCRTFPRLRIQFFQKRFPKRRPAWKRNGLSSFNFQLVDAPQILPSTPQMPAFSINPQAVEGEASNYRSNNNNNTNRHNRSKIDPKKRRPNLILTELIHLVREKTPNPKPALPRRENHSIPIPNLHHAQRVT